RLALREGVAASAGARRVEAAEVLVQAAGEAERENRLARGKGATEAERDGLVVALHPDPGRELLAADARRGVLHGQVDRVQDELGTRPFETDRDGDVAAKSPRLEVRLEVEIVLRRADVGRETETRGAARARHRTS